MNNFIVSVICLCYNHARFIREALDSVIHQTYSSVELIIVDDASIDGSQEIIDRWISFHPDVQFIRNESNLGSTKSFNKALIRAKGQFIIDLAGDDLLLPERIEKQVAFFEQQTDNVGVIYSNAQYLDESGKRLDIHFERPKMFPYDGNIYCKLIDTYFIPTPTMMIRKRVLDELGGYDEALSYEDFDFWIRSSRKWSYAYQPEVLTLIRLVAGSQSSRYTTRNDPGMRSTLEVCKKINQLNRDQDEKLALMNRLKYEIRQAFLAGKKGELMGFFNLWAKIGQINGLYLIIKYIGCLGLRWIWLKNLLRK